MKLRKIIGAAVLYAFILQTLAFCDEKLDKLIQKKSYEKAVVHVEQNIPPSKRDTETWMKLADIYQKVNADAKKVLECYQEALKQSPSDPAIYKGLAGTYKRINNWNEALKAYQRAYLLDRSAECAEGIAVSAANLKQWDKARDAAESAVSLDANVFDARVILLEQYLKEKDYSGAAEQLEVITKKESGNEKYWKKLQLCYEKLDRKEKLPDVDAEIVKLDSKDTKSRFRYADHLIAKNDFDGAYLIYKELALLEPDQAKVFKVLYEIAIKKNEKKSAMLYIKNYLALDSSSADMFKEYGNMQYSEKDHDGALKSYRKALKLDPKIKGFFKSYEAIVLDKKLEAEAVRVIQKGIAADEADAASYIALGNIYRKQGKYKSAATVYQEALKKEPNNMDVLSALAFCYGKSKDINNAIITFEQVVAVNAKAVDEYKELGDLYAAKKQTKNSLKAYKKFLSKGGSNSRVSKTVGMAAFSEKDYKGAIGYLTQIKGKTAKESAVLMALGESYYNTGQFKEAINTLKKLEKRKTINRKKLFMLLATSQEKENQLTDAASSFGTYSSIPGVMDPEAAYKSAYYIEKEKPGSAKAIYGKNTKRFPKDFRNFYRLGLLLAEDSKTYELAALNLNKASLLDKTKPELWEKLAVVNGKLKRIKSELFAYQQLLTFKPDHLEANRRTGIILFGQKKTEDALKSLEIVAQAEPKNVEVLTMLAEGYMKTKQFGKAAGCYTRLKKLNSDDVSLRLSLLDALEKGGQKDAVKEEQADLAKLDREIIKNNKKNVESRVRLAEYDYQNNDLDEAYDIYRELSVLTPRRSGVFKSLYDIAIKKNRKKEATGYLKTYLVLAPNNAETQIELGNLLFDQKDFDGALTAYRKARKLDPKSKGYFTKYIHIVLGKGLDKEAESVIKRAIAVGEADAPAYTALGDIYKKWKVYKAAANMYQQVLKKEPNNVQVLTAQAECYAKAGDTKNAIITYEQVVMMNAKAVEEHKILGDLLKKSKKTKSAMGAYKKYLEKKSSDQAVAQTVGLYEYSNKNYPDAVQYLSMVKSANLLTTGLLVKLGNAYHKTGDCKNVIETYEKVRKRQISPNVKVEILKPLGECYEKSGENIKAAQVYADYISIKGVRDQELSYKCAYLLEAKDPKKAVSIYKANTLKYPKDHRNFLRLGLIFADGKTSLKQSAMMLQKASALKEDVPVIWKTLAEVYKKLGNKNGELLALKKLVKYEPDNLEANRRAGMILFEKNLMKECLTYLEMVRTKEPKNLDVILNLTDAYMKLNRLKEASDLLNKAKNIKKDDPGLRLQLYKLYKKTGKAKQARNEIRELVALSQKSEYKLYYANDLIDAGNTEEAEKIARQIRKQDPLNVDGLMLYGRILKTQKKFVEATELFKSVLYAKENYAPALYERGDIYLTQEELDRAGRYFSKALKADPNYGMAAYKLSVVAKKQKKWSAWRKYLTMAKKLEPKNKEIDEAYKAMKK